MKKLFKKDYDVFTLFCIVLYAGLLNKGVNFFAVLFVTVICSCFDLWISEKLGYGRNK